MKHDQFFFEKPPINISDVLFYEIASSWWAPYFAGGRLSDLVGRYYAWKVRRKHARYLRSLAFGTQLYRRQQLSR